MDTFRPRYQVPFDNYEPALIEWDADEEIIHIPNDLLEESIDYDDQDDQHLHRRENFVDYDIILDHHTSPREFCRLRYYLRPSHIKGTTRKSVDSCSRGACLWHGWSDCWVLDGSKAG